MEIPVGIKGNKTIAVQKKDTALAHGSGTLNVFATPAMVALMENATQSSVQPHLPEGYTTVGTEISIKHIKATPLGQQVEAYSELIRAEGKKLLFNIEAHDEQGKIGFGTHTRHIVQSKIFNIPK